MPSSNVELESIFAPFPRFQLKSRQTEVYRRFRILAPTLTSILDDAPAASSRNSDMLALYDRGEAVGVASFCLVKNGARKSGAGEFARIDLVITHPSCRGKGYGRLLLLSALTYLLEKSGDRLYSISCLAAHPAIAKVLEDLGFNGERREGRDFKLETLNLGSGDGARRLKEYSGKLAAHLKIVDYRARQGAKRP